MKRTLYLLIMAAVPVLGTWSCQKDNMMLFSDVNRINFKDSLTQTYTFYYDDGSVTNSKFYVQVNTIGDVVDYDRKISFVQIPEYGGNDGRKEVDGCGIRPTFR